MNSTARGTSEDMHMTGRKSLCPGPKRFSRTRPQIYRLYIETMFEMGGGLWNGRGCLEWEGVFGMGEGVWKIFHCYYKN